MFLIYGVQPIQLQEKLQSIARFPENRKANIVKFLSDLKTALLQYSSVLVFYTPRDYDPTAGRFIEKTAQP